MASPNFWITGIMTTNKFHWHYLDNRANTSDEKIHDLETKEFSTSQVSPYMRSLIPHTFGIHIIAAECLYY
jgi:hypothetical protein